MGLNAKHMRMTIQKSLKCRPCKNVQIIYRVRGNNRKRGHIKTIYCYKCKKKTPHIELN